jgi:hypothetical protein
MANHRKRLIVALAAGIAVGAGVIASSVLISRTSSAGAEVTDKVRIVDDRKFPAQWMINAAYGRGALSNLRAALAEVENDNAAEARKGIVVAQSLLAKIKPQSPHAAAKAGPLDEEQTSSDLILVHSEVRVLGDADPSNAVQKKLDGIRGEFEMNDHKAIVAALGSLHIPLAYTRIHLPLNETTALVNESLHALESEDKSRARAKLMEIGNGLRIETVRVGVDDVASDPQGMNDAS